MILLLVLLISYHLYQYYVRNIKFYSRPKFSNEPDSRMLRSPANGRVVYCDSVVMSSNRKMVKQGREIECPYELEEGTKYLHIGIYMSPYNNHHLVTMNDSQVIKSVRHSSGTYNDMWDSWDSRNLLVWWHNWFERKVSKWIETNAREIFVADNVVFAIIFDKYVNKIDVFPSSDSGKRRPIGFVYRGSQTDIFIKESDIEEGFVTVGQKVNFDTKLVRLK